MLLACSAISYYYNDEALLDFWKSAGITAGVGLLMAIAGKGGEKQLTRRDGYVLVSFAWVAFSLFGMLPFYISKTVDDSKKERARVLMDKFGIRTLEKKMPAELSGGERQRVAICRALINDPEIIFADEPTGNLDSKSGKIVIDALKDINEHMGKTIIMVTHDPQMASYCSRLILLKDGVILEDLKNSGDQEAFYQEILEKMKEL